MQVPFPANKKVDPSFILDAAPFFLPAILSLYGLVAYQMCGNSAIAALIIYIGTPFYNWLILDDDTNLTKEAERRFEKSSMFLIPLYATIIMTTVAWLHGLMLFSGDYEGWMFRHRPNGFWESFAYFGYIGAAAVLSQASGHEMIHKKETIHKAVGAIPYFLISYSHFGPEHVKGHHKNIATEEDPVSAEKGVSFYWHCVRAVFGTHVTTWNREVERIEKTGGHWIINNQMTMFFLMHLTKHCFVAFVFGKGGMYFHAIYTLGGLLFVESINYIEHYGLRRDKNSDGSYEAVSGFHSWNAPATCISAKIQRHSDHHCISYRPYQILRHFADVPHMPYEYFISILIALCPPLWYYVMDPKVDAVMRAKRGIKVDGEEDQWNKQMPMSAADKRRDWVVKTYLFAFTFYISYMTLRNGLKQ